ncbi:large ribosomal subunit protein mL50-like [Corticium candelabrum]|uniref:large ribosomal subunit protein mL50-like n=1 Tax=Corticium candelabrum TaxID=121492 RepID=UPI002E254B94|nr:large ribosomal subunit protein mL50-like [Corticium candelabrum]
MSGRRFFHVSTRVFKDPQSTGRLSRFKKYIFGSKSSPIATEEEKESDLVSPAFLNLRQKIENIVKEEATEEMEKEMEKQQLELWEDLPLKNLEIKFKILSRCHKEFGFVVPNPLLNSIRSAQDVKLFYLAPPRKLKQFENVDFNNLSPNLSFRNPSDVS